MDARQNAEIRDLSRGDDDNDWDSDGVNPAVNEAIDLTQSNDELAHAVSSSQVEPTPSSTSMDPGVREGGALCGMLQWHSRSTYARKSTSRRN